MRLSNKFALYIKIIYRIRRVHMRILWTVYVVSKKQNEMDRALKTIVLYRHDDSIDRPSKKMLEMK